MIDLDRLADDLASVLSWTHDIDVTAADVRRGLVPFLETVAPGTLTVEQLLGFDIPRQG